MTRKYVAFSKSLLIVLVVMILQWMHIRPVAGEMSPDNRMSQPPLGLAIGTAVSGQADNDHPPPSPLRHIRVGIYENKPKIFTDPTGIPSGIFVDILNDIARKENWQLTYVHCQWDECLDALEQGRIDLMPDIALSPERNKRFDFNEVEVASSWSAVYANSRKPINDFTDLNGRRVAILKGSIQETVLGRMAKGFTLKVDLIETKSFEEAFRLAADGTADAAVSNQFFGNHFYQQYGLKRTPVVFDPVSLYFATASGTNTDLLNAIDKNLQVIKSEPGSVYYKTLQHWMGTPQKAVLTPYLIGALAILSSILVLAVLFILLLRWQVKVQTQNLADADKLLRDSEMRFSDLFNKHSAVKLIIDPDNGDIIEANAAAEKFYGWSGEQLRRMRIQDINTLPPDQVRAEMEKAKYLEHGQFEFQHRLADGSVRDVAIFTSNIDNHGRPFLHSIIHDITERKQAEKERENLQAQFIQAQKMESIGRLAGGVAHDYNNMLIVILGYTELALQKLSPSDPLYADLKAVLQAANRSISITRQLLAFARKQVVEPVVLNLNETVESMLKMLHRLIGENIDLAWVPGNGLWPVEMDTSQVDQILANLCVNARDAIADVGKITIETDNVAFDEAYCALHTGFVPGEYVVLAVSDNGCGMDKQILDHIFEPFFTTKGMGEGTGLGLATVYGIVKQNNGFINAYSEPGKGTTFRIYFPRHEGEAVVKIAESAEKIPLGSGQKVLVVEDDQAILDLCKNVLEKLKYQVLTAGTPDEALRIAEELGSSIDLLVTDVIMPGMNGRDLADQLHRVCPGLKTLYMSGYTANTITHHGGVLDKDLHFIQKPFSIKDLSLKVSKVLGHTNAAA